MAMETPHWIDRDAWPYSPRRAALAEGRLHYIDEGSGPPAILVHGTPTWSFEWRHTIAALRADTRVLALDHLGFGLSDRPAAAGYRPEDHARRFREWIARVVPREPVHLVVHDYGGPIALDWALDHPERLLSVTVLNSWLWSFDDDAVMRRRGRLAGGWLGRLLYRRFNASLRLVMPSAYGDRTTLTPRIHRQYLAVFPDADSRERVLFALARAILASSSFYDGLWARRTRLSGVPLHLVWGMRDSAFQPYVLHRWQRTFPHAETVEIAAAGHWPHEEAPDLVVDALRRALFIRAAGDRAAATTA
jgi:haloalkane dehalogenase